MSPSWEQFLVWIIPRKTKLFLILHHFFFLPFNLQSGDALPLPYFKRTLLPWCPLTEPESAVMGPVSHTTFSVSLNKSLEFQSHFHCCRKAYNNNMSVGWSLGGSQGKCMWWAIMISCTYPSGLPQQDDSKKICGSDSRPFQINYTFPIKRK